MIKFFLFMSALLWLAGLLWHTMNPAMPANQGPGWLMLAAMVMMVIAVLIGGVRDIASRDKQVTSGSTDCNCMK